MSAVDPAVVQDLEDQVQLLEVLQLQEQLTMLELMLLVVEPLVFSWVNGGNFFGALYLFIVYCGISSSFILA